MFEQETLKKERKTFNKFYFKAKELILNSSDYGFNSVIELIKDNDLEENEAIISILERFYREEGALPNNLSSIYLRALFQSNQFSSDIYEKIKESNTYLRNKGIIIDKEEMGKIVDDFAKQN